METTCGRQIFTEIPTPGDNSKSESPPPRSLVFFNFDSQKGRNYYFYVFSFLEKTNKYHDLAKKVSKSHGNPEMAKWSAEKTFKWCLICFNSTRNENGFGKIIFELLGVRWKFPKSSPWGQEVIRLWSI